MVVIEVAEDSAVAQARRVAQQMAAAVGFDEVHAGRVAIAATELATNLIKHGGGGRMLIGDGPTHIDLLALDTGPGMADVERCLSDGFSSAGTAGNGLGAVRRLSQTLHIASWAERGTVVFARLVRQGAPAPADGHGGVNVPKTGEQACGDAWTWRCDEHTCTYFVVDGLGHGSDAALAAQAALEQFQSSQAGAGASELVQSVHSAIRHTRGGAIAVARIEWASGTVVYSGLGNIAGALVSSSGQVRRMVSLNGIAGHNARKIHAYEYPSADGLLIMHSDGIATSWTPTLYPGFTRLHPMLLAGLLFRDFSRGRDDATVVVARTSRP
jgi:anti-sigma regulatory factor (Ser/Thr protein kinase)